MCCLHLVPGINYAEIIVSSAELLSVWLKGGQLRVSIAGLPCCFSGLWRCWWQPYSKCRVEVGLSSWLELTSSIQPRYFHGTSLCQLGGDDMQHWIQTLQLLCLGKNTSCRRAEGIWSSWCQRWMLHVIPAAEVNLQTRCHQQQNELKIKSHVFSGISLCLKYPETSGFLILPSCVWFFLIYSEGMGSSKLCGRKPIYFLCF